jgi:16S rRNA (cytosine967-C5)-methyltransferase
VDKQLLVELRKLYGSLQGELVNRLKRPPRRLYLRVNTLKTARSQVVSLLREEGVEVYPDESVHDAVYIEVKGPYTLECDTTKRIVVDDKTAVSLLMGANLYRPGILKWSSFREGEKILAISRNGVPLACIETVLSYHKALNIEKGLVGINVCSPYRAPSIAETSLYKNGLLYPQSLPSIVTTHVLNPKPGEVVIDMNAAPGGKTSHIVQLSFGKARVIAFDRSENKVKAIKATLDWLDLNINVIAIPMDSRYIHVDLRLQNKADKVLVDPPCSNLGVRPVMKFNRTMKEVIDLSNYQKQFLKAAYHVLKPGGILVYSTCTISMLENEENILYAVNELGYNVVELSENPPYAEKVSYKGIVGYRYSPLSYDMPGYFIAILSK